MTVAVPPGGTPARRFLVSSVVRHADPGRTSGYLRLVDLDRRRVVGKVSVPESTRRSRDPNPRGGLRGVRGMAVFDRRLVVANAERLLVYDACWRAVGDLGHPLLAGIHDVWPTAGGVWAASTSADLLIRIGWDGELVDVWDWRRDRRLVRELGFRGLPPVDLSRDYRDPRAMRRAVSDVVHLNGVAPDAGGGLLLSFGRILSPRVYRRRRWRGLAGGLAAGWRFPGRAQGGEPAPGVPPASRFPGSSSALVRLTPELEAEVLLRVAGIEVPNHNALRLGDWLIYNDSNGGRSVAASLAEPEREVAVAIPGDPGFVRGLAHLEAFRFLVGNQAPLAIYDVDFESCRVAQRILLEGEAHESAYGICPLPDTFDTPPERLRP